MTKISSKSAYPKKKPISSDYFVGTDSEDFNKTVNFRFDEVASLVKELNNESAITALTDRAYAVWTGVGFIYDVIYPDYYIEGVLHTGATEQIILDASDATNPRQDVIAVDATGAIKVTGTAEVNPLVPTVDTITQILITSILVNANATTPVITEEIVYKENSEWTAVSNNGTVNFGATTSPFQGTKHIDCGAFTNGQYLRFTDSVINQVTDFSTLKFYLNLKSAFASTTRLSIRFYNGGVLASSTLIIPTGSFNFNRLTINAYQIIVIPLSAFSFTNSGFDRIEIVTVGINSLGFKIDNIILSTDNNTASPKQNAITSIYTGNGMLNATAPDDTISLIGAGKTIISASGKIITVDTPSEVVNIITDGDTTHSPNGNVVFDALALKVDKDGTKVLSDVNFSTSLSNKLASIDATHYLAPLQTTVQLSALPQATVSDKARVYVENELSDYFYDVTATFGDIAPDDQVGGIGFWRKVAVGGETAASIKVKYESNADTNAFTDTLKAKLDSITAIFTTALKATYDGVVTGYNALMLTGSRLITSGEIAKLSNTSGTNTGDQDLSGKQNQLTAGTNITIDVTNPLAPVISASGGGGSSLPVPIADTASIPFTAMLTTIADHTMVGALTITPNTTGAISGCGAIQQIIADGINVPDLTAFKTLSTSDVYLNIYGKINILVYFFDGSNYNVAIVQNGASVPVNPTSLVGEWKSRLSAAGYSLSLPRETAYIDFITAISSAGVYDLITEMWMHEGGLAATNIIGFKNLKNLIPYGGITYSSTGSTGNGSTGYFDVGYSPSNLDVRDMHMCVYGRSDAANDGYIMGAETNPAYTYLAPRSTIVYAGIGSIQYNPTNPAKSGRYIISRLAGAIHIRRNGTLNSSTGTNTTDTSTRNLFLLGHNVGGMNNPSNQEIGFTSVGKALTTTQSAAFDAALATLFTALSR